MSGRPRVERSMFVTPGTEQQDRRCHPAGIARAASGRVPRRAGLRGLIAATARTVEAGEEAGARLGEDRAGLTAVGEIASKARDAPPCRAMSSRHDEPLDPTWRSTPIASRRCRATSRVANALSRGEDRMATAAATRST